MSTGSLKQAEWSPCTHEGRRGTRKYTGWPFCLFKTSRWHWFESCVLVKGPYTETELSNQCQQEVFHKQSGHPVVLFWNILNYWVPICRSATTTHWASTTIPITVITPTHIPCILVTSTTNLSSLNRDKNLWGLEENKFEHSETFNVHSYFPIKSQSKKFPTRKSITPPTCIRWGQICSPYHSVTNSITRTTTTIIMFNTYDSKYRDGLKSVP